MTYLNYLSEVESVPSHVLYHHHQVDVLGHTEQREIGVESVFK
jgi:hypothetical protein